MDEVPVSLHASIDTGDGEFDMNTLISNNAHILLLCWTRYATILRFRNKPPEIRPTLIIMDNGRNARRPVILPAFASRHVFRFYAKPIDDTVNQTMLFFPKDIGLGRKGPKMHLPLMTQHG